MLPLACGATFRIRSARALREGECPHMRERILFKAKSVHHECAVWIVSLARNYEAWACTAGSGVGEASLMLRVGVAESSQLDPLMFANSEAESWPSMIFVGIDHPREEINRDGTTCGFAIAKPGP